MSKSPLFLILIFLLLNFNSNVNAQGLYPPQYPGGVPPQYPGGDPPQYPGGDPPQYPGGDPPQYPGGDPPQYPGGDPPQYPGGIPPQYPGSAPPQYPGGGPPQQYPGGVPQQYPGGNPPQYPGEAPPQYPGGVPLQYPGGVPSQYPGGVPSQFPGGQYPGTKPSQTPADVPAEEPGIQVLQRPTPVPTNLPAVITPAAITTFRSLAAQNSKNTAIPGALNRDNNYAQVAPYLNCIYDMGDGTYTAYFGYENFTSSALIFGNGSRGDLISSIGPSIISQNRIEDFRPGRHDGAYAVRFDGQPIKWSITDQSGKTNSVNADKNSSLCPQVRAITECLINDSSAQTVYGYHNSNPFAVYLPLGDKNTFMPGSGDYSQPEYFHSGRVNNVFTAPSYDPTQTYWRLGNYNAPAATTNQPCGITTPANSVISPLDSAQLGCSQYSTADILSDSNRANTEFYNLIVASGDKRAARKGRKVLEQSRSELLNWPKEIINCADLNACSREDQQARNQAAIEHTNELYATLAGALRNDRNDSLSAKRQLAAARRLNNSAEKIIDEVPRFSSSCR